MTLILVDLVVVILLLVGSIFGSITPAGQNQLAKAITQTDLPAWPSPDKVQLGTHAVERHGQELTDIVHSKIWTCPEPDRKIYKGINKYEGFYLFACVLQTGKVVILVVVPAAIERSDVYREITSFFSKSCTYLSKLVIDFRYEVLK